MSSSPVTPMQVSSSPPKPKPKRNSTKMATGRQSLNDMLNFSLPPRQNHVQSIPRRSRRTGNQQGIWNKEKFVNAQYRFVMRPSGDYTVHFADPDIYFQWQDILQVIVPRNSAFATATSRHPQGQEEGSTTCPICLSPPTAPRMTKCGHIFCLPCVLHYINTSDHSKWHRCPICFDSITERQLKSVRWFDEPVVIEDDGVADHTSSASSSTTVVENSEMPRPGSILHMRLMQRPSITTLALPRSSTWPSDALPPHQAPFHFLPDVMRFAKFMLATPQYLLEDLSQDLDQLAAERALLRGMGDELSVGFVDTAEARVRTQMQEALEMDTDALKYLLRKTEIELNDIRRAIQQREQKAKEVAAASAANSGVNDSDIPQEFLATQKGSLSTPHSTPSTPISVQTARSNRPRRNLNPPPPNTSTYYYYQAASGAPIFLHPLDIRILLGHFSEYSSFPPTIRVRVEAADEGTVDDALRRRCKYLANMPESADVVFVEANLENVVGTEGMKPFEGTLKIRRSKRREKGRRDDRARAKAEDAEREKMWATVVAAANGSRPVGPPITVPSESAPERGVSPVQEEPEAQTADVRPPVLAGAWGQRSFASALHSSAAPGSHNGNGTGRAQRSQSGPTSSTRREEDDWDADAMWDELESRTVGAKGKKKRTKKLVVLGGAGGRRA